MCHIKHHCEAIASRPGYGYCAEVFLTVSHAIYQLLNPWIYLLKGTKQFTFNYFIKETEGAVEEELNTVLKGRSYN